MTLKNTATIEDLLANAKIVAEAHRRCIAIAGMSNAGDTAQDALLELWENSQRKDDDPKKLTIKNKKNFWTIFTTTARRIAHTNRERIRRRADLTLYKLSENAAAYIPDYYEALESLPDNQKEIAQYKLAGMNNKDIAKETRQRLQSVTNTLKHIRTSIAL